MNTFATRVGASFAACALTLPAAAQSCLGDLNADRTVTGADLGILLGQWGQAGSGDLDANGIVGGSDIGLMLGSWGVCPVAVPSWATLVEAQPDPAVVTSAALRAAIAATGLAWRVRDTGTQIEMVVIPPGDFQMGCIMGSNGFGCSVQELPVHQVTLTSAYYLARRELTQSQWVATMGWNQSVYPGANQPVEQVGWTSIQGYLIATGMRLPSEAEWEFACRAGTQPPFYNGLTDDATVGALAWFAGNSGGRPHDVGGKVANGFGLYDMLGNVWEWVNDGYDTYPSSTQTNPTGPVGASTRVVRGGSFHEDASGVRSSYRLSSGPTWEFPDLGFRVARNP